MYNRLVLKGIGISLLLINHRRELLMHVIMHLIIVLTCSQSVQRHINPMEYIQCPEFSSTTAVFANVTMSTEVNNVTLLCEVRVAIVCTCKSNVK